MPKYLLEFLENFKVLIFIKISEGSEAKQNYLYLL